MMKKYEEKSEAPLSSNGIIIGGGRGFYAFVIIIFGMAALFLMMMFSITKGASSISINGVVNALFNFDETNKHHLIVVDLRLPRVIASALVGASFAVSGAIMQGVTRNPLADSGLMGINAGAGFALALAFAFFPGISYIRVIIISFIGAALGAVLVNAIASVKKGGTSPMRLVLAGSAVSSLLAALSQGVAIYFNISQDIMFWTAGGVAGSNWKQVAIITPWFFCALAVAILISRQITILNLGEEVSRGLGLNTKLISGISAVMVLMLSGSAVSVVGAVGFIGLVIPHVVRFIVGVDYRLIIPCSAVLGALLMVLADLGARMINPPFETPVGAVIAIIGVPFFLYLARNQRRLR